jgi:hypothetical protein
LDRKAIGTGQTSACGIPLCTMEHLGLESTIEQVHRRLVLHTARHTRAGSIVQPFCTFDYAAACRLLWQSCEAEFRQAAVHDLTEDGVRTAEEAFRARVVVDASGPAAVLARKTDASVPALQQMTFGLETVVPYHEEGLHFWYDPARLGRGMAWLFPAGDKSRIGVGSYKGEPRIGPVLDRFLADLGLKRGPVHGGYMPNALGEPLPGGLSREVPCFAVGDAAGQCLGLTGEGIRPALFFGTYLGGLLTQALEGRISLEKAAQRYREAVAARSRGYRQLSMAQWLGTWVPPWVIDLILGRLTQPERLRRVQQRYLDAFVLADLI